MIIKFHEKDRIILFLNKFNNFSLTLILHPIFINFKTILNILNLILNNIRSNIKQFSTRFSIFSLILNQILSSQNKILSLILNFSLISNNSEESVDYGFSSAIRDSDLFCDSWFRDPNPVFEESGRRWL